MLRTMIAVVILSSGCSPNDSELTACRADRLPHEGERCDPTELGVRGFCRLGSCDSQCEDECACTEGRWKCRQSCRDGFGCGTAPRCVDEPCAHVTCPSVASTCASPCVGNQASRIDRTHGCVAPPETVSCFEAGAGCAAVVTCLVRLSDGVAFWFGKDCHAAGFRACTDADKAVPWNAPICGGDAAL